MPSPTQQLVEADLGPGLGVDLLDDHLAVQRVAAIGRRQRAGHHHAAWRHVAVADLAGGAVVDAGGLADEHAHADHAVVADHHALHHFRARADEAVVLDDGGAGLQWLEHAADAGTAGQVAVLAHLGAGADRGPGVHHGALAHVRADVDEAGHQHHVLAEVGAAARHRTRHHAHAPLAELGLAMALEAQRHLVPVRTPLAFHHRHVVDPEVQQHRLLQPLVDLPATFAIGLGNPEL